jgi:hypothetical protein
LTGTVIIHGPGTGEEEKGEEEKEEVFHRQNSLLK